MQKWIETRSERLATFFGRPLDTTWIARDASMPDSTTVRRTPAPTRPRPRSPTLPEDRPSSPRDTSPPCSAPSDTPGPEIRIK
jgi:hypothetical protein